MTVHFRRFLVMLAAAFLLVPGRTGTVSAMPLEGVAVRTEPLYPAGSAALPDTVLLEQIGRYGCIAFMWFPLLVGKFSFRSVPEMTLYLGGNGALLAVYWFVYARYLRERTRQRALTLAVVPACIFLMSGLLLRHWLLVIFALFFAVGHIYVTTQNVA